MFSRARFLSGVASFVRSISFPGQDEKLFYHGVLDFVSTGTVAVNREGTVICVNSSAEEILGIKRKQVLGRYYLDLSAPNLILDRQESVFSLMEDTLRRGIIYDGVELEGLVQGKRGAVKLSTCMLKNPAGDRRGVLLTISDHTVYKLLEDQVQRNECLSVVGQMAAGVAHEIRNPLQSVKGFIQLLQEKNGADQEVCAYTEIVLSEIDRINSLIEEFLCLARPRNARFEKKDLNCLVREVVILVRSEANLRNVLIEEDYSPDLPFLMLDPSQIKQVLINLLSNALAAIPQEGTIRLKTCYDLSFHEARVLISDTGSGMDAETLKQIGKPFFTTKNEGTGLGLFVSFRIIRDHGGRVEVDSTVGKGSTFTIILPSFPVWEKYRKDF